MRNIVFLVMVIAVAGGLGACTNTVDGMGRDIEKAGQSIQGR
jgi:predicted small secreted protein